MAKRGAKPPEEGERLPAPIPTYANVSVGADLTFAPLAAKYVKGAAAMALRQLGGPEFFVRLAQDNPEFFVTDVLGRIIDSDAKKSRAEAEEDEDIETLMSRLKKTGKLIDVAPEGPKDGDQG